MRKYVWLLLAATLPFMAACGDTRMLGEKAVPDEMSVVEGPPLSLPPNFNLRPPRKGEQARILDGGSTAQQILTGSPAAAEDGSVKEPNWLLEQAGADKADPTVREKLEAENRVMKKQGFWEKLTNGNADEAPADEAAE